MLDKSPIQWYYIYKIKKEMSHKAGGNKMMFLKEWKEREILAEAGASFIESIDSVERETAKAVLLNITVAWNGDCYKSIKAWAPKSAVITEEEREQEIADMFTRMDNGLAYNQKLNTLAKESGIKGIRDRMTTATLIKKITEAGIAVPARA